nr:uncharacterized protein LOC123754430 isoform X2 [Procambarus clarkii]
MDREWTYRPPVLVGERVVWLGELARLGAEEPCEHSPHHGTVSWIGKIPEMGNHWTVGVEFDSDMVNGCDGSWNGRHLFTCPNFRGLFLPVLSLIKEKDYNDGKHTTLSGTSSQTRTTSSFTPISSSSLSSNKPLATFDLSLAPEPPPPKTRAPIPSVDITSRKILKQSGYEVIHPGSSGIGGSKTTKQHHTHLHDQSINSISVITSSIYSPSTIATTTATNTTVYASTGYSCTSKSKKEVLAAKLVQKGAQDMSQENKHDSDDEDYKMMASDCVKSGRLGGPGRGGTDEDWYDGLAYFGETMVRKSTLVSEGKLNDTSGALGQNRQPSVSTPSSPTLNDYQRHHGKKLSSSSASTTASDISKYMSSPGRYSMGDRHFPLKREKTSGFLNIFRWFINRDKKKRSTSVDRMSNASAGSVNSLSSSASGFAHVPIMRSKSADTHKKMSSKKQPQFGITRQYKLFTRVSSLEHNSETCHEEGDRRQSLVSASDTLSMPGSRGTTLSRKKRAAPQPPGSPKTSDSESLRSQKSCTSLPARETRPSIALEQDLPSVNCQVPEGRKLQKSKSEGLIYTRVKRRAPLPPGQTTVEAVTINYSKDNTSTLARDCQTKHQVPSVVLEKSDRPVSSVSSGSCLSQSPSSASTTLKSQSSSIASSSQYSGESIRLESGFLRQDITKSSSSPAIPDTGKLTLSPRPWYKRKKSKDKECNKDSRAVNKKEKAYDSWMPDIQFSRSKLSLSGTFRKSKSFDSDAGTLKKSKDDDRKEKRKSQVSLLANISELDRAASEQMQRELEQRRAQKKTYDSKFYKSSEPHILTQTDFMPRTRNESKSEMFDTSTLSSETVGSLDNGRADTEHAFPNHINGIYDNFGDSGPDLTLPQSYSKQATLRIDEKESTFHHSTENNPNVSDPALLDLSSASQESNSLKTKIATTHLSYSPHVQEATVTLDPTQPPSRESPMQRATFDAELFYRLAKDTQIPNEPKNRNSPILAGVRENKKMVSYEELSEEEIEDDLPVGSEPLIQFRRLNKNFGLRMNNFFSPDVSTIIEASESMTSSATTPADDIYEDLPVPSSVNGRGRRESVHDEINSDANYEFRLSSTDAREIMQELADVRQEIQKINNEEEEAAKNRDKRKADKIRDEVLLLRDRNSFEIWQNATEHEGARNVDVAPPPPIDLNEGIERKLKWVCEVCTLINLPWRLQCEACMMRRPANPKRVDEDGKSFTSDHISSHPSISDESPVTVIHDEGNPEGFKEALGGTDIVPDTGQSPDGDQKSSRDKKKKDINWERELQKYFKTFDEHVKGTVGDMKDCSTLNSETIKPTEISVSEAEEPYGKIITSLRNECGATAVCTSQEVKVRGKGAKPKTIFFGTASGPPDTYIQSLNSLQTDNELKTLEFTVKEAHTSEGLNKEPDMEQLRKVRIAKFQENSHADNEINHSEACTLENHHEKRNKKKHGDKKKKIKPNKTELEDDKINELNSISAASLPTEPELIVRESESQHEEETSFYSKHFRKPQVLKPSGAVRNVVSIFNQFEQLQQAKKEKPRVTRRRSFGNIIGRTQIFEQLNSETSSPELLRSQNETRDGTRQQFKSDVPRDTEVFSAIAKFDEMAAIAELEKIEKQRMRKEAAKKKPRFIAVSRASSLQTSKNVFNNTTASQATISISSTNPTPVLQSNLHPNLNNEPTSRKPPIDPKLSSHSMDLSEGIIKGGVLYTEQRKRSMSIGSGTFELIQAKDFETIEAQHSECSPTTESRSITSPVTPSPNGESLSIISTTSLSTATESQSITQSPIPPREMAFPLMPEIIIEPSISLTSFSDNTRETVPEVGVVLGNHGQVEKKEVERLSRQLTEADGIATFKATLRAEEPTLGQINTLNINRLLKRLEGSIARGNHAEAARLAHELAELRVSCSVTRNPRNKSSDEVTVPTFPDNLANPMMLSKAELINSNGSLDIPRTQTPTSNMSECFYDATDVIENEETEISEYNQLDNCAQLNNFKHNVYQIQTPETEVALNYPTSKAVIVTNSAVHSPASLLTSTSDHTRNNTQTGTATGEVNTSGESLEDIMNTSCLHATKRDTRVDPARREVKSDTISKLPDGPPMYMKDLDKAVLPFNVKMYVEDKNSHQGPITFTVTSSMTVGELRKKVCHDFGFPPEVQRWILGRRLADDDNQTLEHHKVTTEGCPIFLYLVAPDSEPKAQAQKPSEKAVTSRGSGVKLPENRYADVRTANENEHPRYLQAFDEEGNVEYRFYNPDTDKYEVSVDVDDSDISGDDDNSDEDTLEEEEEYYENVTLSKTEKDNNQLTYNSSPSSKINLHQNVNKIYRSVSLQSREENYSLPPPLNESRRANNTISVSSQNSNPIINSNAISTSQTNYATTVENDNTHSQSSLQGHSQESYRRSLQSVKRQVSDPVLSLNQEKEHHETVPNGEQLEQIQQTKQLHPQQQRQQDQQLTLQQQSPSNQHVISPESKESIPAQNTQEHILCLPHNNSGSQKFDLPKPTQEPHNRDSKSQSHPLKYSPKQQKTFPPPTHILEAPTQVQHQLPQSKQSQQHSSKLQLPPSQSQQCSTQPSQNNSNELLEQATSQPLHHQPYQLQISQPSQQHTSESPQTVEQPQQQPLQLQHSQPLQLALQTQSHQKSRKPEHETPQQQRCLRDKDPVTHQLSEQQVDLAEDPSPTKIHGWVCPRCTLVNMWTRPGCEACATERPGTGYQQATGTSDKMPGLGAVMSALERQGCVPNPDPFECRVCFMDIKISEGVVLRDCLHTFCRECLANAIKYSDTADVKCPYRDNQYSCDSSLQDREIKALVTPQEYDKHLTKSVKQAEGTMQNVFHCKTPDCPGFCQFEDNVNLFHCDVCKKVSCLTCQAQHEGITCQEYQDDLAQKVDEAAMKTKKFFDDMIRRGDGLPCPKCSVMLVRKWGCDWMRCPMCRTEICWVTRGPRWGPGGPGDVSGGCKCGIRGQKCHPKCTYCH